MSYRYRVEAFDCEPVLAAKKTEARLQARAFNKEGLSALIVKLPEERPVCLFGVRADGSYCEIEEGGRRTLADCLRDILPELKNCPERLRREVPELAPLMTVAEGPRLRASALAARLSLAPA